MNISQRLIARKRTRLAWATAHPRFRQYMKENDTAVVDVRLFERWLEDNGYGNDCPFPSERGE